MVGDTDPVPVPGERIGWGEAPLRVRAALGFAVVGAVLQSAGPVVGLVDGSPPRGFGAVPLLVVLALLPPLCAVVLTVAGRAVTAAGVLVGAALLAPGRALVDAQFLAEPLVASRPEIMVPTSLAPLTAGGGLWLLLGGHLAVAVAGLLAVGRAGAPLGTAYAAEFDDHSDDRSARARGISLFFALVAGSGAAVGLLLAPFVSADAFVLAGDVIESPAPARYGLLALAVATAAAAVFAAGSDRPAVARGVLTGVALAVLAVTGPQIAAGLVVDRLSPAPGPYFAALGIAAVTAAVWLLGRDAPEPEQREVSLESGRVHRVAGVLGLLAGAAALGAAFGDQLVVAAGIEAPVAYSNRLFVPAGLLVLGLSAALLVPRAAPAVRPAFTVALAAVPLAAAAALDGAFTATGVSDDVRVGPGVWSAGVALAFAVAAAVAGGIAGGAERDDVDLTERRVDLTLAGPLAAAALFAVGAFGLPAVKAPALVPPGIWAEFRLASWGLLLAVLVVLAVTVIAPASRPTRAAALLLGAAGLVGVRVLEFPLTAARAEQSAPGPGLWLSLACLAALVVGAATAVARR
ncbi:hypothetical protein SAMN05216174_1081 [Actinokineospora iranica]|uniref:Uncharacterized protein n=2 Tax=Actinokineospora iranica TaxID=1271860 RepID=A0A1G6SIX0_9PSEU|nr:hypothetical protein SAMN05216174_1081 [Actinokineospora iranica]